MRWSGDKKRPAADADEACAVTARGEIAVMVDPAARFLEQLQPDAVIDAILAAQYRAPVVTDAPSVIGLGPGFEAGVDCHAVIGNKRRAIRFWQRYFL